MHHVWLTARTAFTFGGQSYVAGELFSVAPLVAVQLKVRRVADLSKAQAAPAPTAKPVVITRRRRLVVQQPPVAPVIPAEPDAADPSADPVDMNAGAYARKDLRAE